MSKPETRTQTRVEVTKDGPRFRARLILNETKRKEPKTMNYREYDPNKSCLPAEAYPYLALALARPKTTKPSLLDHIRTALRKLAVLMPLAVAVACLPEGEFRPVPDSQIHSLVWVQPLPGKKLPPPPTLPRLDGNPYSL